MATLQMLNWFRWRHRIAFPMMIGSVIVAQVAYWLTRAGTTIEWLQFVAALMLLVSFLGTTVSAFSIFTFGSNLNLTNGRSSFPAWLFTLPVATSRLALVTVTAMVLGMAWGWFPFAAALANGMRSTNELAAGQWANFVFLPWIGMVAFGTWTQALSWWPFRSAWHRLFAIGTLVICGSVLFALGVTFSESSSVFPLTALLVSAISGFVTAILSAKQARHLSWRSEQESSEPVFGFADAVASESSARSASLTASEARGFASSAAALRWRDWKQLGRVPVILMFLLAVPMMLNMALFPTTASTTNLGSVYACVGILLTLLLPAGLAQFVSPAMGKTKYWKSSFELSPYLSALPISDSKFLTARFANLFRVSALMWVIALLVVAVWMTRAANRENLSGLATTLAGAGSIGWGWSAVIAIALFTLYLTIVAPLPGMALGLCGRSWLEMTVVVVSGVVGFAATIVVCKYVLGVMGQNDTPELRAEYLQGLIAWLPNLLVYFLVAKLLATAGCVLLARQRGVINWPSVAKYGLLLTIVFAAITGLFWFLLRSTGMRPLHIAGIVAVLLPCASLFFARFALDWNRHR